MRMVDSLRRFEGRFACLKVVADTLRTNLPLSRETIQDEAGGYSGPRMRGKPSGPSG